MLEKNYELNLHQNYVQSVEQEYGERHAEFYLNSAIKKLETKKRKAKLITQNTPEENTELNDEENEELNLDEETNANEMINPYEKIVRNEEIDLDQCDEMEDNERIIDAFDQLPSKNVTYNEEDKSNILIVFKLILDIALEREFCNPKIVAARTAEIMFLFTNIRPYYSQITSRTILRWYSRKDKINEKTGPKINEEFERAVWGKLMLCCFEQVILHFIIIIMILIINSCQLFFLSNYFTSYYRTMSLEY
jgi:hypothetical protein